TPPTFARPASPRIRRRRRRAPTRWATSPGRSPTPARRATTSTARRKAERRIDACPKPPVRRRCGRGTGCVLLVVEAGGTVVTGRACCAADDTGRVGEGVDALRHRPRLGFHLRRRAVRRD